MKKVFITALMLASVIYAQTEYPHVQDNGGGYREGAGYRSYASIGQAVISPAYPNPFNSKCQIEVAIPRAGAISFSVYDLFGRKIYTTHEKKPAGTYTIEFDAGNLPSGVYLYRVAAGNTTETGRLILVK